MQHGSGQDQSDWMNMGDVPVIMDNLLDDGLTEPAIVVTTATNYLGQLRRRLSQPARPRHPVRREHLQRLDAAARTEPSPACRRARRSPPTSSTTTPTMFGYYGVWSGGVRRQQRHPEPRACPTSSSAAGRGTSGCPTRAQVAALDQRERRRTSWSPVPHDFNTWNQLFTTFARDYLWQRGRVRQRRPGVRAPAASRSRSTRTRKLTFTVAATDPDGDALTYSADDLPAGATFDPATRQVSWTRATTRRAPTTGSPSRPATARRSPGLSGTKQVTITVRDVPAGARPRCTPRGTR